MKTLAIVISYNFMPWIDRCLPSLLASVEHTDILVIDNGSSDETIAVIRERYPQVQLIANGHNLGFGAANNIGLQVALDKGYSGVLLINQDAWIESNTLRQLVEVSLRYSQYGIITPKHLTGDGSKLDPGFASYVNHYHADGIVNVPFINAAIWYIPIVIIKKVGMFAPLFYHYGEDKDYVNRIHYFGYQIGYVTTAIGYHDRAERPFNQSLFLRTEYVYHLSEYSNINYTFSKAFAMGVMAPVKKAGQSLFKAQWRNCIDYLTMSIKLLMHTYEVYNTRKQAKK